MSKVKTRPEPEIATWQKVTSGVGMAVAVGLGLLTGSPMVFAGVVAFSGFTLTVTTLRYPMALKGENRLWRYVPFVTKMAFGAIIALSYVGR